MKLARSTVASVILAIAMVFGWISVTTYLVDQSLFAPGRFAAAAKVAISDPTVRAEVAHSITMALYSTQGSVSTSTVNQIDTALGASLLNPTLQSEFTNAFTLAQEHVMGLYHGSYTFGGPALKSLLQTNLAAVNPQLAAFISAQPAPSVTIPGTGLPNLGKLYQNIHPIERDSLAIAIVLALIALLVSPRKGRLITTAGFWLMAMSVAEAFLFWILPRYIIPLSNSSWSPVLSHVISALAGPAGTVYITLFASGIVLALLGRLARR